MATNAHTEVPGGGKPGFPPFQPETFASQLLWLAITFVALYALVSRVILPRVGGIIEARRDQVSEDLAAAQRFKTESEAALAAYEKALADARARAQALANETREKLNADLEARRHALEAELNLKLAEAEKQIADTKMAAMANVKIIAAETAAAIVERLIGKAPSPQAVEQALAETLKS
jgi:F-type H+-transporting ATPase subunit b